MKNAFILSTSTSESGRSLSSVSCFQWCQMPICRLVAAEFWLHLFRTKYAACNSIIIDHPPARLSKITFPLPGDVSPIVSVMAIYHQLRCQRYEGPLCGCDRFSGKPETPNSMYKTNISPIDSRGAVNTNGTCFSDGNTYNRIVK